jgi:prephenate dehydrogenase
LKQLIETENVLELAERFESARFRRDEIPKNSKGFLTPLHDLFVFVSDEPGVISRISTALYEHNINIKDIELLKIREGTGGTFRLSFESKRDAQKAAQLLKNLGFTAKN